MQNRGESLGIFPLAIATLAVVAGLVRLTREARATAGFILTEHNP